jgi:hypothetical protein
MKRDVVRYVYVCFTCLKVKVEHKNLLVCTTVTDTSVEMGVCHYGFCVWIIDEQKLEGCYLSNFGSID